MAASSTLVKAQDLAPKAFGGASINDEMSSKVDDLVYDVHHLLACDTHPINLETFEKAPDDTIKELTTFGVRGLMSKLFHLDTEPSQVGPIANLPAGVTVLPRAKPIPPPRKETKWEKFATEKGIQKRKKSRMVWDEQANEWRPRWGYKRANAGAENQAVIEVKEGDDPCEDPWTKARQAKKARVEKNLEQQRKNEERGKPKLPSFGLPVDLPAGKKDAAAKTAMKKGKAGGKAALEVAQLSTASIGRFDKRLPDEPVKVVKKPKVIAPLADRASLQSESEKLKNMTSKILKPAPDKSRKAPVNIDALEPERDGYNRKKGRGHKRKSK